MKTLIIGIILLIAALFGTPLFAIISLIAILAFIHAGIDTSAVIVELYQMASTYSAGNSSVYFCRVPSGGK